MTGEEMERAIEFLLQSQANSEARLGRLEAAQEETNQQISNLASAQQRTQEQIDQGFVRFQNGMDELRQQVSHVAKLAEIALEKSLRNSDAIDALTKLVGGLVEGRGGGGAGRDG